MVVKGLKKKSVTQKKKSGLRFVVDCQAPVADGVIDAAGLVSIRAMSHSFLKHIS
jgi:hypothetical protein